MQNEAMRESHENAQKNMSRFHSITVFIQKFKAKMSNMIQEYYFFEEKN